MGNFPNNLANLRIKRQLTQEGLAKRIGISQSAIWQYENGEATPKIEIAIKLAECLGTTVESLVKGDEGGA